MNEGNFKFTYQPHALKSAVCENQASGKLETNVYLLRGSTKRFCHRTTGYPCREMALRSPRSQAGNPLRLRSSGKTDESANCNLDNLFCKGHPYHGRWAHTMKTDIKRLTDGTFHCMIFWSLHFHIIWAVHQYRRIVLRCLHLLHCFKTRVRATLASYNKIT